MKKPIRDAFNLFMAAIDLPGEAQGALKCAFYSGAMLVANRFNTFAAAQDQVGANAFCIDVNADINDYLSQEEGR